MTKLCIKCPDGFVNQLRLSLAANYLVSNKIIESAEQEWVINNHNVVSYEKFFHPLPNVKFVNPISDEQKIITTQSFTGLLWMINKDIKKAFRESYKDLIIKEKTKSLIDIYINENDIKNCIGVHVRTGCKTAILLSDDNRNLPTNVSRSIIELLHTNHKIYLATDNHETQEKYKQIFGDRLLFFDKIKKGKESFGPRYDRDKVRRFTSDIHVVADFLILQKCKKFIGSNESSFSIAIKWLRENYADTKILGIL